MHRPLCLEPRTTRAYAALLATGVCFGLTPAAIGCSSNGNDAKTSTSANTGAGASSPRDTGGKSDNGGVSGGKSGSGGNGVGSSNSGSGGAVIETSGTSSGSGGGGGLGLTTAGVSGGASGKSGASAVSGSGGASGNAANDDEDAGVCTPLASPISTASFTKCSMDLCPAQDSVCIPLSLLTELKIPASTTDLLADCDDATKCVPESLASEGGRGILPTCTSLIGAEGRCTSACVPQVKAQITQLPKDTCTGSDLCAPCYDPRTGAATGACSQGCDPGPSQPAKTFDECCSTGGYCVPPSLAGAQAPSLNADTCSAGLLCAPKQLTDPTFKPATCASLDDAEGRCVSTCIGGAIAQQRANLPTAGCGSDEVCAPCYDPITGDDTGACTINGDAPTMPKYTFPQCCNNGAGANIGVCVTPALAGSQAGMLQRDTCATGKLCAPAAKAADPTYKFPGCTGIGSGACVPSCILPSAESALFSMATCGTGELCAPCDVLGQSTGACD
jgi:hypothetical protein